MQQYQLYIDGQWRDPAGGEWFDSINPYTGEAWCRIPRGNAEDVDAAARAAHRAMYDGEWARINATQRGHRLRKLGDLLFARAEHLARTEVQDNGKLLAEMLNQCRYLTEWFHYFGGLADKIEGTVPPIDKADVLNFTRHEPIGVTACITPWNSPLLLMAWKVAPALAAGNAVVIKPSEFTSASTLEFARVCDEAGLPPGLVNVVTGYGAEAGEPLVTHPLVRKVAFTGGESGGRHVAVAAARDFKHTTLELGGKSANIVLDDARIDDAVSGAISGIFAATGQTCIAGSRLLLHERIHDEFLGKLLELAGQARFGDPMDAGTQIGPVTTEPQFRKVVDYLRIAKEEGARCVMGGDVASQPPGARGFFVQPTIFADVTPDMRIAQEEVFGPVLSVIRFSTDEEAIRIANSTNYGLAAGVWTESLRRAVNFSKQLQAGTVWVNTYRSTSYTTPFGGVKASGLGRENGMDAIREYLQTKSVWFYTGGPVANPYIRR
ncbi:aldehyde dehydrogenase [Variovorax sp. KK3]|uniref:aldehyde dehydrogenase n=1 Tax=Variovorax sp. KK3 TaxID=1855728 RepID=UPI00097C1A4E|nr:aldehyde dehydrogenase [Variovorax sp. KK3]